MKSFSKKEALAVGWQTFKERPFFLIGLFVLTTAVSSLVSVAADAVGVGSTAVALSVVDFAIQICIGMGLMLILLRVYDRAETSYGDIFEPLHLFWKYAISTLLVLIVVTIGLVFFVVPGIIAIIALVFAPYLIVDRNLGPVEALKESMSITRGHWWNLLFFGIIVTLINLLGAAAFGLGLFITVPVTALAAVHVYRWLLNPPDNDGVEISGISKIVASIIFALMLAVLIFFVFTIGALQDNPASVSERDVERQADVHTIQLAASLYYEVHQKYPTELSQLNGLIDVPVDPQTGAAYAYNIFAEGDDFEVCTALEGEVNGSVMYCLYAEIAQ